MIADAAIANLRGHTNELEEHLLTEEWEKARDHASHMLALLDEIIDAIDEGKIE